MRTIFCMIPAISPTYLPDKTGTIGNHLFTFKLLEKEKLKIKKLAVKKGFLCFYSVCMFVYIYLCVCFPIWPF